MNFERVLSKNNSTNTLNLIEQAVLHTKSQKLSNELSEQLQTIENASIMSEEPTKDIISTEPTKPVSLHPTRWQFFAMGICGAIIGAGIVWGVKDNKTQFKTVHQIAITDVKPDNPDPNWSGLKMSYKIGK